MELSPGTQVNANVRLTRPLGQGAMGEVWVAEHLTLRTEVAVKFITPQLGTKHEEVLTRFEQEAAMAAQIKSPHVVQTFDQGKMEDGTPYIVMELLEGESLQELLDRVPQLSPVMVLQVVSQVSRALRKAHKLGIIHRDIKPDNIFILTNEDGVFCKILDFGIAKQRRLPQMGGLTHAGIMIGTPEYMSPEQVMSAKDVDGQADIWALAATAYQMLTGELAFEGEAIGELCVKLLEGRYQPASELRADLPPAADAFFARAFQRDKNQRFGDVREMARELQLVFPDLHTDPLTDTLDSLPPPAAIMAPRHRLQTQPGVVDDDALFDDAEPVSSTKEPAHEPATVPRAEVAVAVKAARVAGSATLNGSTASRPLPDEVRKRKGTNWFAFAAAAALLVTLGGIGLMVGLTPAAGTGPAAGRAVGPAGTGDQAAVDDGAAAQLAPEPAVDDTDGADVPGPGASATAVTSASAAASSKRPSVAALPSGTARASAVAPRTAPAAVPRTAKPASSSGRGDHGF